MAASPVQLALGNCSQNAWYLNFFLCKPTTVVHPSIAGQNTEGLVWAKQWWCNIFGVGSWSEVWGWGWSVLAGVVCGSGCQMSLGHDILPCGCSGCSTREKAVGLVELLQGCTGGPAILNLHVLIILLFSWLGEHLTPSLPSLPAASVG